MSRLGLKPSSIQKGSGNQIVLSIFNRRELFEKEPYISRPTGTVQDLTPSIKVNGIFELALSGVAKGSAYLTFEDANTFKVLLQAYVRHQHVGKRG